MNVLLVFTIIYIPLISAGLLLWNLGSDVAESAKKSLFAEFQEVSLRLGIALFTVGVLHGLNILAISLFQRKSAV